MESTFSTKILPDKKTSKNISTPELDYLIDNFFTQKYDKNNDISQHTQKSVNPNGLNEYTYDDYIELDQSDNSVKQQICPISKNGDEPTYENIYDDKRDLLQRSKSENSSKYDGHIDPSCNKKEIISRSHSESVKTVKKRTPPMKPPRVFTSTNISSPVDKNGTSSTSTSSQACKSCQSKSCKGCNCDFSEHDVSYNDIVNTQRMAQLNIHDVNDNIMPNDNPEYLWAPPGLDEHLTEDYMRCIPLEKVPHFDNPEGIKYYNKQLIQQLPLQDTNIENINTLTPKDKHYVDAFKRQRDPEMSTGIVYQADEVMYCKGCNEEILQDEVFVFGEAFGNDGVWHPNCFVCCTCNELLVNLIYCFRDDEIYCPRHHAEQIKPRCHACDELIFCGEYIRTDDKAYHSQHFTCVSCDHGLSGEQHLLDEGLPICIPCYDLKFANTCHMCNKTIGVDEDDVVYDDQHWHDYCLVCNLCKCKLSGTSFVVKDSKFLCSDCFQKTDDKRCNVCGEGFEPGAKRLELKGEYWHDTCFVCDVCKDPITSKRFIHHEGKQVCCPCFDAQFAKRCDRCKEILREGGVSCGGVFFHRDCFSCENCDASIANQAFQQKNGQRYCTPCYKKLYAKTCSGCGDYIVNGEFYTVESDNWHKNCFKCVNCGEVLQQQSFVTEDGKLKLLCENCL